MDKETLDMVFFELTLVMMQFLTPRYSEGLKQLYMLSESLRCKRKVVLGSRKLIKQALTSMKDENELKHFHMSR